jgi:hypothetical protein
MCSTRIAFSFKYSKTTTGKHSVSNSARQPQESILFQIQQDNHRKAFSFKFSKTTIGKHSVSNSARQPQKKSKYLQKYRSVSHASLRNVQKMTLKAAQEKAVGNYSKTGNSSRSSQNDVYSPYNDRKTGGVGTPAPYSEADSSHPP